MFVVESLDELYDEDFIAHHGIKDQKWGRRRFQNPDGSLTPAGRKRYLKNKRFRDKYLAEEKKRKEAEARAKETAKQRHDRLMKSNDPKELLKHIDELTTDEIKDRINRIDTERKLAKLIEEEPTAIDKINKFATKAKNFADSPIGKKGIKWLKKELGIDQTNVDYKNVLAGIYGLDNDAVEALAKRAKNEREMRNNIAAIQKMLTAEEQAAEQARRKAAAEKAAARRKRLAKLGIRT